METEILNFISSLINFCEKVLTIPLDLYTKGLVICPWVPQWIEYFKTEHNVDIIGILPQMQEILKELTEIKNLF